VVLPHEVIEPKRAAIGVEDLVERRVAVIAEGDLVRLVLRKLGYVQIAELCDQRLHLRPPLAVELGPVLVVEARSLLEELSALGDLGGIGDGIARDVDVAIDDPVVDAHRRGHREDAVLPRSHRLVGGVDADHVERRHRYGEVHRVPEPEAGLVGLAPAFVEQRVVGVHLLPALAARRGLDRERTGKSADCRRRAVHTNLPRATGRLAAARSPRLIGTHAREVNTLAPQRRASCTQALDSITAPARGRACARRRLRSPA